MAWSTKAKRQAYDAQRSQYNLLNNERSTSTITGADKIYRRLEALARWSVEAENQLLSINRRVAKIYLNYLNANIKDFHSDILVQFKDRQSILVEKGTLRKSLGMYRPAPPNTRLLAGPLTNNIGRRKRGIARNGDGWFAHIVEGGDSFGIKKRTVNTGVFMRGKAATQQRSIALRDRLLRKEFSRYMNTLLRA